MEGAGGRHKLTSVSGGHSAVGRPGEDTPVTLDYRRCLVSAESSAILSPLKGRDGQGLKRLFMVIEKALPGAAPGGPTSSVRVRVWVWLS